MTLYVAAHADRSILSLMWQALNNLCGFLISYTKHQSTPAVTSADTARTSLTKQVGHTFVIVVVVHGFSPQPTTVEDYIIVSVFIQRTMSVVASDDVPRRNIKQSSFCSDMSLQYSSGTLIIVIYLNTPIYI